MIVPVKALAAFIASPQGRRVLQSAKTKLDTPENRKRLTDAVERVRASRAKGPRPA